MEIYIPAQMPGAVDPIWVQDRRKQMEVVPGSIVDTVKRVLQIATNRMQIALFFTFDEINLVAGAQILEPGTKEFPRDGLFDPMRKEMLAWQVEKGGVFGFELGMTHHKAAEFYPVLPDIYTICGGKFGLTYGRTRLYF
ncbi:MAG: hypothetical protein V4438_00825 [Patescibacteria group bacterium]